MAILRAQVMQRATTIWPLGSVPYSQSTIRQPDGYRQDCSGYVSMCWALPLNMPGSWGGLNTVSLVSSGVMYEIDPNGLLPGDAVGRCGPGTAGDAGHIQLFVAWLNQDPNDSRYYCLEQAGGTSGPRKRLYDWPDGYRAYRFRGIADDPTTQPAGPPPAPSTEEDNMLHGQVPPGQTPIIVCAPWSKSSISFGCDFGKAKLRVAEHEVNVGWHVYEIVIDSQDNHRHDLGGLGNLRVNIDRRCIMRVPLDAKDPMTTPVGYLAWWA